jgi:hypothetical protein
MEQLKGDKDELVAASAIISSGLFLTSPILYGKIAPFVIHNLGALGAIQLPFKLITPIVIGGKIIPPKVIAGVLLIAGAGYIVYKVSKNK